LILKQKNKGEKIINPSKIILIEKPVKVNMTGQKLNKKTIDKRNSLKLKETNQNNIKQKTIKNDLSKEINIPNFIKEKKISVKRNNNEINSKNMKFLNKLSLLNILSFDNMKKSYFVDDNDEDVIKKNDEKIDYLKQNLQGHFKNHIAQNYNKKHNTVRNMFRKNNSFKQIIFNRNKLNSDKRIYKKEYINSFESNKNNKKKDKKKKIKKSSVISMIQIRKDKKKMSKKAFKEEIMDDVSILNSENITNLINPIYNNLNKIHTIDAKNYINKCKKEIKFINHIKNIAFINKTDLFVPNPFENINLTLMKIKSELLIKEYDFEKEIKCNPKFILFIIYELNKLNQFVKFISLKYFGFFKEFVDNISHKKSSNDIDIINKKLRNLTSTIIKGNFSTKNIKNSLYIHKFIQIDNLNHDDELIKKNQEIIHIKSIKKTKRNSSIISIRPRKEKRTFKFQLYNFNRMIKKLDDYSSLRRKSSFLKLINLRPKHLRLSYIALNEKCNPQQVFKQLKIYVIKNEIEKFKKFFLLHLFNINLEECDEHENTLLMLSVIYNCKEIFDFLIEKGANINTQNIYLNTPLHYAFAHKNYKLVDKLIKNGADETIKNRFGQSYFESARLENE
jgi:hypothetical protein